MTVKKLKKLYSKYFDDLRFALGLPMWDVEIVWNEVGESKLLGHILIQPDSMEAVITIMCGMAKDEKQFLDTLRHELLHIIHAETSLYRKCMGQYIDSRRSDCAMDEVYDHMVEKMVARMEYMLDLLGLDAKTLAKKGKEMQHE